VIFIILFLVYILILYFFCKFCIYDIEFSGYYYNVMCTCSDNCDLQHNTMGVNCEICEDGFFRPSGVSHNSPDACHPCMCDVIGSTGLCFKDDADEHLGIVSQILAE